MNSLTNEQIKQIIDGAPSETNQYEQCGKYWYVNTASNVYIESPMHNLSDLAEIFALRERVAELDKHCTNMTNQVSELMQETAAQAMLINELQAAKIDAVREFVDALWDAGELSGRDGEFVVSFSKEFIEQLKEQVK